MGGKPTAAQLERQKLELQVRVLSAELDDYQRKFREDDIDLNTQRIYDFVGDVDEGAAETAIDVLSRMRVRSKDPITLRILSNGGDVLAGLALYDYIQAVRSEGIHVTTVGLGIAASMAGVLLQAGDTRLVTPNTYILIHEVSQTTWGKLSEVIDTAKFAKRLQNRLLDILAGRSTLSPQQIQRRWSRKDWYLDPQEAVRFGFADGILSLPQPKRS